MSKRAWPTQTIKTVSREGWAAMGIDGISESELIGSGFER